MEEVQVDQGMSVEDAAIMYSRNREVLHPLGWSYQERPDTHHARSALLADMKFSVNYVDMCLGRLWVA